MVERVYIVLKRWWSSAREMGLEIQKLSDRKLKDENCPICHYTGRYPLHNKKIKDSSVSAPAFRSFHPLLEPLFQICALLPAINYPPPSLRNRTLQFWAAFHDHGSRFVWIKDKASCSIVTPPPALWPKYRTSVYLSIYPSILHQMTSEPCDGVWIKRSICIVSFQRYKTSFI